MPSKLYLGCQNFFKYESENTYFYNKLNSRMIIKLFIQYNTIFNYRYEPLIIYNQCTNYINYRSFKYYIIYKHIYYKR